jgi:hypothetical protein
MARLRKVGISVFLMILTVAAFLAATLGGCYGSSGYIGKGG